jgi:hypothetical protein
MANIPKKVFKKTFILKIIAINEIVNQKSNSIADATHKNVPSVL